MGHQRPAQMCTWARPLALPTLRRSPEGHLPFPPTPTPCLLHPLSAAPCRAHALLLFSVEDLVSFYLNQDLLGHIQVCVLGLGGQAHVCVDAMHTYKCVSSACHVCTHAPYRANSHWAAIRATVGPLRQQGPHTPQHRCSTAGLGCHAHPPHQDRGTCMSSKHWVHGPRHTCPEVCLEH